jgi:hypothetical protein
MQILLVCSADIGIAMNCHAILHSELLALLFLKIKRFGTIGCT